MAMRFKEEYLHENAAEVRGSARGDMGGMYVCMRVELESSCMHEESRDQQNIIGYSSGLRKVEWENGEAYVVKALEK